MAKKEHKEETAMTTRNNRGNTQPNETSLARREQFTPARWSGSPFSFMRRFSEEMDRLFGDFGFGRDRLTPRWGSELFPSRFGESDEALWSPDVEMFERDGQLVVRADLPGLTKDDVKVEITDNVINLSGERKSEHEEKGEGYYRSERSYGSFYRSIPLPQGVNADDANATFNNGVLEITMAAPQLKSRGRRLEIKEGSNSEEQPRAKSHASGR